VAPAIHTSPPSPDSTAILSFPSLSNYLYFSFFISPVPKPIPPIPEDILAILPGWYFSHSGFKTPLILVSIPSEGMRKFLNGHAEETSKYSHQLISG
jgi:hypothetical protein